MYQRHSICRYSGQREIAEAVAEAVASAVVGPDLNAASVSRRPRNASVTALKSARRLNVYALYAPDFVTYLKRGTSLTFNTSPSATAASMARPRPSSLLNLREAFGLHAREAV